MYKNGMGDRDTFPVGGEDVKTSSSCQLPTPDNPLANVLLSDYTSDPDRPPACSYPTVAPLVQKYLDETFPNDEGDIWGSRNLAARTFYSTPATTIPNDQTAFAEACYGKKKCPILQRWSQLYV